MNAADSPSQTYLNRQYKFGFTIRNKQLRNRDLVAQIDQHLYDKHTILLPDYKADHERSLADVYNYDLLGRNGGEALQEQVSDLVRLRYAIVTAKGYYAKYTEGEQSKLVPLAFWYSRHRLDHVWNWRKSQIIRNKYYQFLQTATDKEGHKLTEHYLPVHLVLTVPHKGGLWQGKRFYVRELMEAFTAMRKRPQWKELIYGGEYGVEVKRSKEHGLHIHIHSFLLQNPDYSINTVRDIISGWWAEHTGNFSDYSGIHYETLYNTRKINGKPEKQYLDKNSTTKDYLSGVMECIKYHFKPDCLEKENGTFDIELIDEILSNTKGVRLYSRYGKFYNVKELNFNNLETESDTAEELETTVRGVEDQLVSPFTGEATTDYVIAIGNPLHMKYENKESTSPYAPYMHRVQMKTLLWECPGFNLSDVIRLDLTGKITYDQLSRINNNRAERAQNRTKERVDKTFGSMIKMDLTHYDRELRVYPSE